MNSNQEKHMKRLRLMNSAMMPREGTYHTERISAEQFTLELREAHRAGFVVSSIGYTECAHYIWRLTGIRVSLNRDVTQVNDGDTLLIIKLGYRLVDPKMKGRLVPEKYQFFRSHCRSISAAEGGQPDAYAGRS